MSCIMEKACSNSTLLKGEQLARCALCRLSEENVGRNMVHHWSPTRLARAAGTKHPMLETEKRDAKRTKFLAQQTAKRGRDVGKRKVSRQAAAAEKKTEQQIIHATKNSGRRNKDGDHVFMGTITLDTKLQTTRENPVIFLAELEKVRSDAARAGKTLGGLVLRNKHGVGCVVLKEEDYVILTEGLINEQECGRSTPAQVGPAIPGLSQAGSELVERS